MKAFLLGILKIAGLLAAFMVLGAVAPRVGQGIALLALAIGGVAIAQSPAMVCAGRAEINATKIRICFIMQPIRFTPPSRRCFPR